MGKCNISLNDVYDRPFYDQYGHKKSSDTTKKLRAIHRGFYSDQYNPQHGFNPSLNISL